jgi:putative nucleotidyltransferase with HDIG domain
MATMIAQMSQEVATAVPDELQADLLTYIESRLEIPMLPAVVWEVVALTASNDADARRLSAILHRDQALASHVLRVANSPAYKPIMPIVSLQQAVSRLGITTLGEIAFAVSLQSRIFDAPGYEAEIRLLWQHAVATAAYAKDIARRRRSNVEGAFLCGLLHDIGKPVILQALLDLHRTTGVQVTPGAVSMLLEAHHCYVGCLIAGAWTLPPHVTESILYHHAAAESLTFPEAVMVTRFADVLAYHLTMPEVCDEDSVRHHPVVLELNLYPDEVDALLSRREAVQRFVAGMR